MPLVAKTKKYIISTEYVAFFFDTFSRVIGVLFALIFRLRRCNGCGELLPLVAFRILRPLLF